MSYGQKLFLKVILAGEAEVGKTSLKRLVLILLHYRKQSRIIMFFFRFGT
ncbi:MAG: hypothetical protein ACTSQC_06935 [Candidatus Heimdallarchaeaceae archaeon]